MKKPGLYLLSLLISYSELYAQKPVSFPSSDGIEITADLYMDKKENPFVILFHQEGSSRGEFRETAPKMMKFGYNCLAVDLRSGKEMNYISNETNKAAVAAKKETDYASCIKDIKAAIEYGYDMDSTHKVLLIGSCFSASLCMIVAENNPKVKGVIAFSPGEYFGSEISLKDSLQNFDKPALVTGSTEEADYWKELFSKTDQNGGMSFFVPEKKKGMHGSKALWKECDAQIDYWIEIMMFVKKVN